MKFFQKTTKQPRKKRKAMYNADIHTLKRDISIHLNKELRKTLKKRSRLGKKGDKVRILTGEFRKKEGKITDVNVKTGKIYVEGVIVKKQGGKEKPVAIEPSNCILLEWNVPKRKERPENYKKKEKKPVDAAKGQQAQKPAAQQPLQKPVPQNPVKKEA
ncbi:MAG: 50S ribosomal protein L24, partial [Candidatus Micrarchaeota archaeon]